MILIKDNRSRSNSVFIRYIYLMCNPSFSSVIIVALHLNTNILTLLTVFVSWWVLAFDLRATNVRRHTIFYFGIFPLGSDFNAKVLSFAVLLDVFFRIHSSEIDCPEIVSSECTTPQKTIPQNITISGKTILKISQSQENHTLETIPLITKLLQRKNHIHFCLKPGKSMFDVTFCLVKSKCVLQKWYPSRFCLAPSKYVLL